MTIEQKLKPLTELMNDISTLRQQYIDDVITLEEYFSKSLTLLYSCHSVLEKEIIKKITALQLLLKL